MVEEDRTQEVNKRKGGAEARALTPSESPPPTPENEDTQRKRIEELLVDGYTPVQIEKEWGYPHSTVRDVAKKKLTPKGMVREDPEAIKLPMEIPRMPLVLKAGAGCEVISPEAILQSYLLSDGDAGTWMFKGMMLLRAAQLMNLTDVEIMKGQADAQAKALKPIMDVMEQARKDMDAAAQRAKESNVEIAEAAAMGAAGGMLGRIDAKFAEFKQQKTDIATVPDPMKGLMARTMEMMMNRMTDIMGGSQGSQARQVGSPPGFIDTRSQVQGGPK